MHPRNHFIDEVLTGASAWESQWRQVLIFENYIDISKSSLIAGTPCKFNSN
jgi:hypothetical protein